MTGLQSVPVIPPETTKMTRLEKSAAVRLPSYAQFVIAATLVCHFPDPALSVFD